MIMPIGRNDPCPCGSGKKYKRCCLNAGVDPACEANDVVSHDVPALEYPSSAQMVRDIEELLPRLPTGKRRKIEPLMRDIQLHAELESRRAEIDAAIGALESHRADFEALKKDERKFMAQSQKLFDEEVFKDMSFSSADARRAFEKVGYPSTYIPDNNAFEIFRKAILYLASDKYRQSTSMRLFLLLPVYVHAGRYLDAWIIQHSAWLTTDKPKSSNPFLLAMFLRGYREWAEQRKREEDAMLKDLGITPEEIRRLGAEGIEKWLEEQSRDPAKKTLMEKKLAVHPEMQAVMNANCRASEQAAIDLLERDDARALLLSTDEVAPWLREIEERFSKMPIFAELQPDQPPAENIKKELCDLFWNVSIEMAQAIFTPSRLKQLNGQLHDYHRRLLADGDQKAVMAVHGALMAASPTTAIKDQPFLMALCYTSLYTAIQNMRKSSSSNNEGRIGGEKDVIQPEK